MEKLEAPALPPWIEAMLPEGGRRRLVDVGGEQMHVMEHGEGYPVLMLHGNPTWGFLYRRVIAELAGAPLRCIAPDMIGLGFSSHPRSLAVHTLDNHARWIGALIDQLELKELILVVQDWGGPVGLRALADRPSVMRGLVVLNTLFEPFDSSHRPAYQRIAGASIGHMMFRWLGLLQKMMHQAQRDRSTVRGDVARAYRYPLRGFGNDHAPLALVRMIPSGDTHPSSLTLKKAHELLAGWQGPTAVVWGERDPIVGKLLGTALRYLPKDTMVERTDAGHFIQEEEPQKIAAAIKAVHAKIVAGEAKG